MVQKVTHLTNDEMKEISRELADAFLDYEMTPGSVGMAEYLNRKQYACLIRAYFEAAVRNGSLYRTGESGEGYMILMTPDIAETVSGSLLQLWWMLRAYGLIRAVKQVREIKAAGPFLSSEMRKAGKPCAHIEMIAVKKAYWHQGHMRRMMEYAMKDARERSVPLLLCTDDAKKVRMYEHFGMTLARQYRISDNSTYYDMIWEPDASADTAE